jgi:hypothetical protein
MALGMKGSMEDLGVELGVQVNTDTSVAKSIASRRGTGRVRHIEVRELWLQDRVAKAELSIVRVSGEHNFADGLTKHVGRRSMGEHTTACGVVRRSGRHELCPWPGGA